jgi:nicotinamidase/pyrazinamidase
MKITPQDALIVIDVQNDFCPGGQLAVPHGDAVIAPVLQSAKHFQHVILTQDWHPAGHSSFASSHPGKKPYEQISMPYGSQTLWPDHCVQGTKGAEFHPWLRLPQSEHTVRKGFHREIDSYSAFFENDRKTPTGLADYLREHNLARVFLAGLAYDYCVGCSALDAKRLGLPTFVIQDACRAISLDNSVTLMEVEFTLAGVGLIESAQLKA